MLEVLHNVLVPVELAGRLSAAAETINFVYLL